MARRAQMLALLPLASLVLLLAVQLTDTAPVTDAGNSIPLNSDDGDEVFSAEQSDVTASADKHVALGDQVSTASSDSVDHASTAGDGATVSDENLDKHHDSVENKFEDQANTVDGDAAGTDENVDKHQLVIPTKTGEDDAGSAMDNIAENMDKPQVFIPVKTEQAEANSEMDSTAENMDEQQHAKPTKTEQDLSPIDGSVEVADTTENDGGEDAKMVEASSTASEETQGHSAAESEEDTSVKKTTEAVSKEHVGKQTEEDLIDGASEENMDKADGSTAVTSSEYSNKKQPEEKNENSLTTVAMEDDDDEHSKEQTVVEGKVDESASADEESSEHSEESSKETAKESILKEGDIAEDEDGNNSDTDDGALQNSSEETADMEDVEVNINHSIAHDVTSSPFAQLRVPSSDSHLTEKDHEDRPSVEETGEKEPGAPEDLIENDKVDSHVFNSDNKTASMGRSMPIAEDEEDAEKDKTEASSEEMLSSETAKESHAEVKHAVEHENREKTKHITDDYLPDESENENLLEDDDKYPEESLEHFSGKNDDEGPDADEETLAIGNVTETSSEEEGSGSAPGGEGLVAHGAEMSAEHLDSKEEKKSNKEDEMGEDGDSGSGLEDNTKTPDIEDGVGSGSHAMDTTESYMFSIPVVSDDDGGADDDDDKTPNSGTPDPREADDKTESTDHHSKEENLTANKTDVPVMSVDAVPESKEGDDHQEVYDGSGDDETTTPLPIIISTDSDEILENLLKDIVDDDMELSNKGIELVNGSDIGEARHAFQEEPVEKVISPQLAAAPASPSTKTTCEEDEDCEAGASNDLEDDDQFSPDFNSKSVSDDDVKESEAVTSTAPVVKEESSLPPVTVDLNEPLLHSGEEVGSTAATTEEPDFMEPIEDREDMNNLTMVDNGAPDTIVEHPFSETGVKQMSGKIREANVNELGISGQQNTDDLSEAEALDSSSASGSYVVLGCIMAVVVVLLAYAAIKSRRERGANTSSKKQNEVAGDDDDGTELKDMKLALLPPETPHDDCNGDVEANRKPLISKDEHQEEDEDKEPIIKQNGTLERSKPPADIESQVDSSPAENQSKAASTPNAQGASPNKPQLRNGLSEVVVEKPSMSNGKADSIITQPVSAKVKVIENEDSIAKTPVFINRGGTSPPR